MKTLYCLLFGILSFSSMSTAFAHDDGLTCHTHPPSSRFSSILITSYQTGGVDDYDIYLEEARHRFDNRVAEQPQGFDPVAVRQLRAALTDLEDTIFIILNLIDRSERSADQGSRKALLSLARDVFDTLSVREMVPFWKLRQAVINRQVPALDIAAVRRYLVAYAGVADSLVIALENAAQSC